VVRSPDVIYVYWCNYIYIYARLISSFMLLFNDGVSLRLHSGGDRMSNE
jgi:hypothetical protein